MLHQYPGAWKTPEMMKVIHTSGTESEFRRARQRRRENGVVFGRLRNPLTIGSSVGSRSGERDTVRPKVVSPIRDARGGRGADMPVTLPSEENGGTSVMAAAESRKKQTESKVPRMIVRPSWINGRSCNDNDPAGNGSQPRVYQKFGADPNPHFNASRCF